MLALRLIEDDVLPPRRRTSSLLPRLDDERTAPEERFTEEPERPVTTRTDELRVEPLSVRVTLSPRREADVVPRLTALLSCEPRRVEATVAWRSFSRGREPGVTPPHPGLPMPIPGW